MDRKNQERMVQRRVLRCHEGSSRPVTRAAMAKANGMVNPTYPRYRLGGWMAMAGFCSRGFMPSPSGCGGCVAKGWAANSCTARKKAVVAMVVA